MSSDDLYFSRSIFFQRYPRTSASIYEAEIQLVESLESQKYVHPLIQHQKMISWSKEWIYRLLSVLYVHQSTILDFVQRMYPEEKDCEEQVVTILTSVCDKFQCEIKIPRQKKRRKERDNETKSDFLKRLISVTVYTDIYMAVAIL